MDGSVHLSSTTTRVFAHTPHALPTAVMPRAHTAVARTHLPAFALATRLHTACHTAGGLPHYACGYARTVTTALPRHTAVTALRALRTHTALLLPVCAFATTVTDTHTQSRWLLVLFTHVTHLPATTATHCLHTTVRFTGWTHYRFTARYGSVAHTHCLRLPRYRYHHTLSTLRLPLPYTHTDHTRHHTHTLPTRFTTGSWTSPRVIYHSRAMPHFYHYVTTPVYHSLPATPHCRLLRVACRLRFIHTTHAVTHALQAARVCLSFATAGYTAPPLPASLVA